MEDGSASFPLLLDPQANSVKLAGSAASQLKVAQSSAGSAEEANALVKAASEAEQWAQKVSDGIRANAQPCTLICSCYCMPGYSMFLPDVRHACMLAPAKCMQAYSPYTHSPSGAAIITHSGQVYGGCWVESVAFNPSMSPFHVAWIHAVTAGTGGFEEVGALNKHARQHYSIFLNQSSLRAHSTAADV